MVYNQQIYKFNLEGLARYVSNLDFKVTFDLVFEDDILERFNKSNDSYTQRITKYMINFNPRFSSFYSDDKCLLKIFIPKTSITFYAQYLNNGAKCRFEVDVLNESFLNIEITKEDLDNFSLDFSEAYEMILDKIDEYCSSQFKKLENGVWDKEDKWFISCNCTFSQIYAQFS